MPAVVIVGAQWGDEGKGKIVDIFTEHADLVVRYAGGPNAGHTLVVGDEKFVVRLIPSGILHPHTTCVLAQGMVIDPASLVSELDELARRGLEIEGVGGGGARRLVVSDLAHAILPYHLLVDRLRESGSTAIGTTKRGVGPCYEDKVARRGLRLGDLRELERARTVVANALEAWAPVIRALGGEPPSLLEVMDGLAALAPRIVPLLEDAGRLVGHALASQRRVMFEGAQGTLLDVDHGTYPFVTSSSAIAGGACTGAGVGPTRIDSVVGLVKAYTTRVGGGPFPTELTCDVGERLRTVGAEFGSVTGRPRRTGWLDLPALRHAARVNGFDGIALTKLDVLTGLPWIDVCVAYETPRGTFDELSGDLGEVRPVYARFEGWTESLASAKALSDLPAAARKYVESIAEAIDCPLKLVSVGQRRDETIVIDNPLAS